MPKEKTKQVVLRAPRETILAVSRVAKLAGVTPTQAYNVILALALLQKGR